MKKAMVIVTMAVFAMFMVSGIAYAEGWKTDYPATHYGFSLATEGCAGCHVTHTATAAKLLKNGNTQTDFCYGCHAGSNSPYDVETGKILKIGGDEGTPADWNNSTGGKFGFLGGGVTSRHDVDSPTVNSSALAANEIPGNTSGNGFTGGFKCGSCHDVHAGDASNDRLLKSQIWSGGTTLATTVNFVYDSATNVVQKYALTANEISAINGYCGLCHNRFNVGDDSAKTVTTNNMYRHAIGVALKDGDSTNLMAYVANPDPGNYAANKNIVLCLTCHYAHGTTAVANTGYTSWDRDPASNPATGSGSALLRLDKRGVCYDCHGAASKNLEQSGQGNT